MHINTQLNHVIVQQKHNMVKQLYYLKNNSKKHKITLKIKEHDNTLLGSLPGTSYHTFLCSYPKSLQPALQLTQGEIPAQE